MHFHQMTILESKSGFIINKRISLRLWNKGMDSSTGAKTMTDLTNFLGEIRNVLRLMANGLHDDVADMKILSKE